MDISATRRAGLMCRSSWSTYNGLYMLFVCAYIWLYFCPPCLLGCGFILSFLLSFLSYVIYVYVFAVCACASICPCKCTYMHAYGDLRGLPLSPSAFLGTESLTNPDIKCLDQLVMRSRDPPDYSQHEGYRHMPLCPALQGCRGFALGFSGLSDKGSYWLSHWPKPLQSNHHDRNFWHKLS